MFSKLKFIPLRKNHKHYTNFKTKFLKNVSVERIIFSNETSFLYSVKNALFNLRMWDDIVLF